MTRTSRMLSGLVIAILAAALGSAVLTAQASPAGAHVRPLPVGTDADYQLGGAARLPGNVGIVTRDRTSHPAPGVYSICYVNGFQTQPNEQRLWRRHPELILRRHGRPVVDEHWGEFLLDVRTPAKRHALAAIMRRWVRGCASKGFAAVEFDNLDSFTRSHRLITRPEALAYARVLVKLAHRAGLAAGQKNLAGWDGTTVGYDFAVSEECAHYDECGDYLRHYGRHVVMIEYDDADFAAACRRYGKQVAIVRRDRDLLPGYHPRYC